MHYTTLGRTGLKVSVAGLGCGGNSRIGLGAGLTSAQSVALIHAALDLGVNLIDTAEVYGTEEIVGKALEGRRDQVVLSTKALPVYNDKLIKPKRFRKSVERSLKALRTDRIDLFFVHGMGVRHLQHCRDVLVPELLRLQEAGKIRYLAASEAFASDQGHDTIGQSLDAGDDWYDVLMVGHNPFNPSARDRVFAATQERDIGILVMFAVRKALASPDGIRRVVQSLVSSGHLDPELVDLDDPLGFLVEEGVALRDAGITLPVLVMGPSQHGGEEEMLARDLTPVISEASEVAPPALPERLGGPAGLTADRKSVV